VDCGRAALAHVTIPRRTDQRGGRTNGTRGRPDRSPRGPTGESSRRLRAYPLANLLQNGEQVHLKTAAGGVKMALTLHLKDRRVDSCPASLA
jgi:hypothetical protein